MTDFLKLHADYRNKGTFSKLILDSAFDAVLTKSPDGIITSWNKGAEKIYRYTEQEILGKQISILVPPNKSTELSDILKKINKGEKIEGLETQRIKKDGTTVEVVISVIPISENGNIIGAAVLHRDISLQKEEERKYFDLFEQASDAIFIADLNGRYTEVNTSACKMLGYSKEELIGKTIIDLIPPEDIKRLQEAKQVLLKPGAILIAEWTLKKKDGTFLPVEVSAKILPDGRWQAFVRDISKQKELSAYARNLIEASPDPFIVTNLDGLITDANKAALDILESEKGKLSGTSLISLFTDPESLKEIILKIIKIGQVKNVPLNVYNYKGNSLDFLISASVYEDYFGKTEGIFYVLKDISELIKIASKLISESKIRLKYNNEIKEIINK